MVNGAGNMGTFEVNAGAAARHGELIGRAGAILGTVDHAPLQQALVLRDTDETVAPPPRREVLTLALGKRPALLARPPIARRARLDSHDKPSAFAAYDNRSIRLRCARHGSGQN